jgi:type II secretory pathway pseudopilin PulG
MGGVMLATFLVSTIVALFERAPVSFGFWSIMGAAETAAWRLKWIAIPTTIIALWAGSLICRSIRRNPKRFMWGQVAHSGLWAVIVVAVLIATLIGITVPERLYQRELREEAAIYAQGYTIQRALLDYRARYGSLPATLDELGNKLPDPDHSIADALAGINAAAYSPGADLAALPKKKSRSLRGSALRNASLRSTDDAPEGGLSFTRYEMRLPGPDNKLGTEDDWMMRDGVIIKPLKLAEQAIEATLPPRQP